MGMTTEQINSQRLDTVREPVASLLMELTRRFVLPKKRIIAIGRCQNGGAFTVTTQPQAPADFEAAIAEVLTPDRVPTVRNMAGCEDEHIGEEFSTRPFLW